MKKYPHTESPRGFTAILFCLMVVALAIACGGGGDSGEDVAEPGTTEELAAQEERLWRPAGVLRRAVRRRYGDVTGDVHVRP